MNTAASKQRRRIPRWIVGASAVAAAAIAVAACGSSSKKTATSATTTAASSGGSTSTSSPATTFSAANVSGLGMVVVDGAGKTVYLLTGSQKNVPCDDASGCTKVWPDLPLPDGVSKATAGSGLQQSLMGTMKLSDGETYPTYGGYLMYEFTGDSGPAQGHGQGIKSFGGTWYALTPAGTPVNAAATGDTTMTTAKSSSSGNGGY